MLIIIYSAGSIVAFLTLWYALQSSKYCIPERILLFSIGILPLGKLIYFPIPGFIGLKITFLVAIFSSLVWLVSRGLNQRGANLLILFCIAGISLGWLEDPSWLWFYNYVEKAGFEAGQETGTTESAALRVLAFAFLLLYCGTVITSIARRVELITVAARYFVVGTLLASIVGVIIFIGVWTGSLSVVDLAPISVDSHFIEGQVDFYRFNPGANVNEFSMILAFAIFLLFFVKWKLRIVLAIVLFFSICQLAALTRSSWIGIVLGLTFGIIFGSKHRRHVYAIIAAYTMVILVIIALYNLSDDLRYLIETRLALDIGVSGEERLEKFSYVISRLNENSLRLLFGYGWSTNLYVHSVYFQLLYEIGLVGTLLFSSLLAYLFRGLLTIPSGGAKVASISAVIFIAVSASMQHILYHVQTWFMLGFVVANISTFYKSCARHQVASKDNVGLSTEPTRLSM